MDKLRVDENAEYKQNKAMKTQGLPRLAQLAAMLLFLQLLLLGGPMGDVKDKEFEKRFVKNVFLQDLIRGMNPEFKRILQPLMGFTPLSATKGRREERARGGAHGRLHAHSQGANEDHGSLQRQGASA
eukprot:3902605-Heterocapsa_arctica.AAC.1